jgi:putative intracellular protease/amidase
MVGARPDIDGTTALNRSLDLDRDEMRADLREAYERGRKDERSARKRHPLLMTLTFAAAAVGAVVLTLAAVNGSFSSAGGVVDQNLDVAVKRAEPQVKDAAAEAGQSLKEAGNSVKAKVAGSGG